MCGKKIVTRKENMVEEILEISRAKVTSAITLFTKFYESSSGGAIMNGGFDVVVPTRGFTLSPIAVPAGSSVVGGIRSGGAGDLVPAESVRCVVCKQTKTAETMKKIVSGPVIYFLCPHHF